MSVPINGAASALRRGWAWAVGSEHHVNITCVRPVTTHRDAGGSARPPRPQTLARQGLRAVPAHLTSWWTRLFPRLYAPVISDVHGTCGSHAEGPTWFPGVLA